MNTRTMLRKSLLIEPAETALKAAKNQSELEDAWFDMADNFADETPERKHLLEVYMDRLAQIKAEHWVRLLGAG
jgi:hypothetical protein